MDSHKFGEFIQTLRKERGWTQAELAQRLHVTDKAVSKWERGSGFPDIKLIEPMADTLGVSILEIMKSERIDESAIVAANVNETISDVIDIAILQKRIEKRNLAIGIMGTALVVAFVFLLDTMQIIGFILVYLPILSMAVIILLGIMGIYKRRLGTGMKICLGIAIGIVLLDIMFLLTAFPTPT